MQISIEGMDAVSAALQQYTVDAVEKMARGIAEGCRIVADEAKANAPVDTGELRDSITSKAEGLSGTAGTNKNYAAYQEFGTYKMKAHPFLVPALKNKQPEVIAAIMAQFGG